MGKLRDLRDERDEMNWEDPRRIETEKEINRIEQYCIDNNYGGVTKLTVWTKESSGGCLKYPWHTGFVNIRDIYMVAELNGKAINYNSDNSVHHCSDCVNI